MYYETKCYIGDRYFYFFFPTFPIAGFSKTERDFLDKATGAAIWRNRRLLDADAYNEIDDQFALAYTYLSNDKLQLEAVYAAPFLNNRSTGAGDEMEKATRKFFGYLKCSENHPKVSPLRVPTGIWKMFPT